jgi:hypothetical protein
LERWIVAQAERRSKLADMLSSKPLSPGRRSELHSWRQNLQTKKAWLQARLEHVDALEQLLNKTLEDDDKASSA